MAEWLQDGEDVQCHLCRGEGEIPVTPFYDEEYFRGQEYKNCRRCGGDGFLSKEKDDSLLEKERKFHTEMMVAIWGDKWQSGNTGNI